MSDARAREAARELGGDLVLRAGAGTGKTHTLVEACVHLVAGTSAIGKRVPPARLLALTFGEKAAAELRERVRARFEQLALAPDGDAALVAAYAARKMPVLTGAEWRTAAHGLSGAPISTFHGFAAQVLRRHGASVGLDPAFMLLDEEQASQLRRRAAEETVLGALGRPEIQALVREVHYTRGADGGHGKGLVEYLMMLAARLDEEGRDAAALAGELDDPGDAAVEHAAALVEWRDAFERLVVGLMSLKASALMRTSGIELTRLRPFVRAALDAQTVDLDPELDPSLSEVHRRVSPLNVGADAERKAAKQQLKAAHAALARAHASVRSRALSVPLIELASAAEAAYRAEKQRRSSLDFADLLRGARDLLAASAAARAETGARFDAILVDEFQDTNPLQKQLLELARAEGVPRLVVGDPKQSIYEFRGADVAVFGTVARETGEAGGQVLALTASRRARAPITALVNKLFERALRGGERDFEVAFDPQADALAAVRGKPDEGARTVLLDEGQTGEPAAVAGFIRRLVEEGTERVFDRDERPRAPRWGDVAILLRRFSHLEEFLAELRRAGIPHHVVGGRGFYQAQEVRDLCHALALLDDRDDQLALLGVLRSPLVGLSDVALVALAAVDPKGKLSLRPFLDGPLPAELADDEAERLAGFIALYRRLRKHADRLGVAGILRALAEATDLPALLAATAYGEQKLANLEQLIALAEAHDADGGARAAFLRRLRAQAERDTSLTPPAQVLSEGDDVVRVMTVHQAKGLEFRVVVVPECAATENNDTPQVQYDRAAGLGVRVRNAEGALIDSARTAAARELRRARAAAESLRLFYVAVTRARDLLVVSGTPKTKTDCWRKHIEQLVAEDPAAAALVRRVAGAPAATAVRVPSLAEQHPAIEAGEPLTGAVDASEMAALQARFEPPRTPARTLVAPVTELADFEACARRYRLRHELGLAEHPEALDRAVAPVAPGALDLDAALAELDPGALDPLARGTLAHRMLERIDLADARARGAIAVDELLAREGYPAPLGPDAVAVRAAVLAMLDAPFGRQLAARASTSFAREESFVFAPRGGSGATRLLLKGQIDLVLFDDDAITVIDYKLAASSRAHDYRFQLAAYAAAARALWKRPVRAGLLFLKDRVPEPRLVELDDAALDQVEARLAGLAASLADARRTSTWPGRELAACRAIGCGYVARCHGQSRPPLVPPPTRKSRKTGGQLSFGDGIEGW